MMVTSEMCAPEHAFYCFDVLRARLYDEKHIRAPFEDARLYEATPGDIVEMSG